MFCTNCGQEFEGNFCPNCGTPASNPVSKEAPTSSDVTHAQSEAPTAPPQVDAPSFMVSNVTGSENEYVYKSKWTAFFLCLFLGLLGIHRFYVGKIGTGILWLLTLGLVGIGALVDLICILTGAFRDKNGKPLK